MRLVRVILVRANRQSFLRDSLVYMRARNSIGGGGMRAMRVGNAFNGGAMRKEDPDPTVQSEIASKGGVFAACGRE
eukprot:12256-Eustigmatos_ZCMA.PRE.1